MTDRADEIVVRSQEITDRISELSEVVLHFNITLPDEARDAISKEVEMLLHEQEALYQELQVRFLVASEPKGVN